LKKHGVRLLPESLYRSIYIRVPRLTVDILLKRDHGLVFVKRDIPPCKGFWIFPGGTVLLGESLEQAVKRVAKDETGLVVRVEEVTGVLEYSRRAAFGQVISVVVSARAISGRLRGNKYGREVEVFSENPPKMITEQSKFIGSKAFRNIKNKP